VSDICLTTGGTFQYAIYHVDSAHRPPPPPERVSVGIQAQPSWAVSSVQAVPITSPVQIGQHLSLPEDQEDLSLDTRLSDVVELCSAPQKLSLSPALNAAVSAFSLTYKRDPETQ
jgi:hypothetical protein